VADLSDVTAYLAQQAAAAVYPAGTSQPSVGGVDCRIYEGWPNPDQLDLDMAGKMLDTSTPPKPVARSGGVVVNVSVFPLQGTGVAVFQILDDTYVIQQPTFGVGFSVAGNVITCSGAPAAGEYLTLIADNAHIYSATGANLAAMLAALATQAQVDYPSAVATATTLTVPVNAYLVVRQGGKGKLGKVTHRQKHAVMITVWAPKHDQRSTIAAAIDNALKQTNRITLPDTSQAIVVYSRTNVIDEQQTQTVYRRDLIFDVEYATVEQFDGYVVTSTTFTMVDGSTNAIATAVA
jgi:hypothetical protein